MNETNNVPSTERRQGASGSIWGELMVESAWRPSDKPPAEPNWLRAHGYLADRRAPR